MLIGKYGKRRCNYIRWFRRKYRSNYEYISFYPCKLSFCNCRCASSKNTAEYHLEDVLSRNLNIPVIEIQDKMQIKPAHIYIAPGDYHLLVDDTGLFTLDYSEK